MKESGGDGSGGTAVPRRAEGKKERTESTIGAPDSGIKYMRSYTGQRDTHVKEGKGVRQEREPDIPERE